MPYSSAKHQERLPQKALGVDGEQRLQASRDRTDVLEDDIVCGYAIAGYEEEMVGRGSRVDVSDFAF